MSRGVVWILGAVLATPCDIVRGDVTYLDQQRTVSVATTADGNASAASAPNFGPFVGDVSLATTIPVGGGTVVNAAAGRIDCQINPNSIRAAGTLSGTGGAIDVGGALAVGESKAVVIVSFEMLQPQSYSLSVAPRPAVHASDQFELSIRNRTDHSQLISMNQTDPPTQVEMSGVLAPGTYLLKYTVEATFDDVPDAREYLFRFLIDCRADVDGVNGVGVEDIFAFLTLWFAGDTRADFDGSGALSTDDVLQFLNAWFAGC